MEAVGYQSMPKQMLWDVSPKNLQDWDIEACMWNLVVQLVDRVGITLEWPEARFKFFRDYVQNPQARMWLVG